MLIVGERRAEDPTLPTVDNLDYELSPVSVLAA